VRPVGSGISYDSARPDGSPDALLDAFSGVERVDAAQALRWWAPARLGTLTRSWRARRRSPTLHNDRDGRRRCRHRYARHRHHDRSLSSQIVAMTIVDGTGCVWLDATAHWAAASRVGPAPPA
jgi:hypothetical protein